MIAIAFDTLAYANRLKKAGVKSEQAEAEAEALYDAMSSMVRDNIATKQDLREVEHRLKNNIRALETKVTLRIGTMLAAGVGLLSTLLVILHIHP